MLSPQEVTWAPSEREAAPPDRTGLSRDTALNSRWPLVGGVVWFPFLFALAGANSWMSVYLNSSQQSATVTKSKEIFFPVCFVPLPLGANTLRVQDRHLPVNTIQSDATLSAAQEY